MKRNEAQFINTQRKGRLWRSQVVVADLAKPPTPQHFEVLFSTAWMRSVDVSQSIALQKYFEIYRDRQGFKHPEDPSRTMCDAPPPCDVVTLRAA